MTGTTLAWRIAGGSGDGIDSTSQNFTKALMRSGLHVFTHRHYPSRIRGDHAAGTFQRFARDPEGGVNPRPIPGQAGRRYLATGNESEPTGDISEDPGNRRAQMDRQLAKLDRIRAELDGRADTRQTAHAPDRPSYGAEKRAQGDLPEDPLAERYFDDDADWERAADGLVDRHTWAVAGIRRPPVRACDRVRGRTAGMD
jgi:hypothetical protein